MSSIDLPLTGHPDPAWECRHRVRNLLRQLETTDDVQIIDDTIQLAREALALSSNIDADEIDACLLLASSLRQRLIHNQDEVLLEEIITLERQSLALCGQRHQERARCCAALAISLSILFEYSGVSAHLDEVIDLEREALALRPTAHPNRATSASNLVSSLIMRYDENGDVRLLDEALNLGRETLALCSKGHPDRASSCANLAITLRKYYDRTGSDPLLTEAIAHERESLALRPAGHPRRAASCANLAVSLRTRYEATGRLRLLNEAISLGREVLSLHGQGHPDRASSSENLAILLTTRYEHTGDGLLLDEAILLQQEALALRPKGHPNRAMTCSNMALLLWTDYERTGNDNLLNEAIILEREALALCPAEHPDRAMSCGNMATSLKMRYDLTGDYNLLVEAVNLEREALVLRPQGHFYRAASCSNLASSCWALYERTGEDHFLKEAIKLDRESLALRPTGHPDRAMSCEGLATSLCELYELTGDRGLLDDAIGLQREALDLRPQGHPHHARSCGNLAITLRTQFKRMGGVSILDEMLELLQEALQLAPAHTRWIHLCELAWLHVQKGSSFYDVNKSIRYLSQSLESEFDDIGAAGYITLTRLDDIWYHDIEDKHSELVIVYQRFMNLLPLLANSALDLRPQLEALERCTRVGSDAFVNAVLAGDLAAGLETLEVAQGVIWSQSVFRRDPQLRDVPKQLASKLEALLRAMGPKPVAQSYDEERTALTPQDVRHAQSSQVYALVREIRTVPGLGRYMLGETYEALCQAASTHPVAVLVGARRHYYALVINPSQPQNPSLLPLDLTEEDLKHFVLAHGTTRAHRGVYEAEDLSSESSVRLHLGKRVTTRRGPLDRLLGILWYKIVSLVLDCLELKALSNIVRPRLHWCSTGMFSSLPLHAAGIYEGPRSQRACCTDFVVSSYTPTITALLRAQRATVSTNRDRLSFALVAEKRAHEAALSVIPGVDQEIDDVAVVAKLSNIKILHQRFGSTTVADTAALMQDSNIVHLACHGVQDEEDSTQSGFCLGDGRLTIAKLMELKLDNAFLAFLSACETAKGDKEQPDQVMHLAASMLFSGFKSVVATMWAIRDDDGPKVAKWFYEDLFSKEVVDADSVASALDTAVGKLRDSGVSPDRWAPFIHMGA